jgi:phage regulator Rha-like protein
VDGYFYHKKADKIMKDVEKGAVFKQHGFSVIRVKDARLEEIPHTDLSIFYDHKEVSQRRISDGRHQVVIEVINRILGFIGYEEIASLSNVDAANNVYIDSRQVAFSDSVASTHPHLLREIDTKKCSLDPLKIQAGSSVPMHWRCPECEHSWSASIEKRTAAKKPTGCPACAGQVVTDNNCVATVMPQLIEAFYDSEDAKKVTTGSGKRMRFICTHPDCQAPTKLRAVKDVVKQFNNRGHCFFHSCNHHIHD